MDKKDEDENFFKSPKKESLEESAFTIPFKKLNEGIQSNDPTLITKAETDLIGALAREKDVTYAEKRLVERLLGMSKFRVGISIGNTDFVSEARRDFERFIDSSKDRLNDEGNLGEFLIDIAIEKESPEIMSEAASHFQRAIEDNLSGYSHFIWKMNGVSKKGATTAIRLFESILKNTPDNFYVEYFLGVLLGRLERLSKNEPTILFKTPAVYLGLGKYWEWEIEEIEKDLKKSEEIYRTGIEATTTVTDTSKGAIDLRSGLGWNLLLQNQYAEAEEIYRGIIKTDPENPRMHNQLGGCFYRQKKYIEAIHAYQEAHR